MVYVIWNCLRHLEKISRTFYVTNDHIYKGSIRTTKTYYSPLLLMFADVTNYYQGISHLQLFEATEPESISPLVHANTKHTTLLSAEEHKGAKRQPIEVWKVLKSSTLHKGSVKCNTCRVSHIAVQGCYVPPYFQQGACNGWTNVIDLPSTCALRSPLHSPARKYRQINIDTGIWHWNAGLA